MSYREYPLLSEEPILPQRAKLPSKGVPAAKAPKLSEVRMAQVEAVRATMSALAADETVALLDRVLCLKLIALRSNLLLDHLVTRYCDDE